MQTIHDFVKHVVEGTPASPDILDGAKTQAVMEAALESQRIRTWKLVPEV